MQLLLKDYCKSGLVCVAISRVFASSRQFLRLGAWWRVRRAKRNRARGTQQRKRTYTCTDLKCWKKEGKRKKDIAHIHACVQYACALEREALLHWSKRSSFLPEYYPIRSCAQRVGITLAHPSLSWLHGDSSSGNFERPHIASLHHWTS